MTDEREGRKKEASKVKQTTRQSNTALPRQSLFLRKMSCLGWDSNPRCTIYVSHKAYIYRLMFEKTGENAEPQSTLGLLHDVCVRPGPG